LWLFDRTWGNLVGDLRSRKLSADWYEIVTAELDKRGLAQEVDIGGKEFVANRKEYGVVFAQFCFHAHCNKPTGSSADLVKQRRKFGVMPFLFASHPEESRFLLSFLLSCWRYLDSSRCVGYPEICETCDQENSSIHVLFECVDFALLREDFEIEAGMSFSFDVLELEESEVCRAAVRFGKKLYLAIAEVCEM
jgi:hypothetical protein